MTMRRSTNASRTRELARAQEGRLLSARRGARGRLGALAMLLVVQSAVSACGSSPTDGPLAGIPRALVLEARPIGRGVRFQPLARGPVIGHCTRRLGPRVGVHVEVFAANRVVIIAAGIGTRPPLAFSAGRITRAGCYGALVTLEPTGVVLTRPGVSLSLGDLFRSWGEPLSADRMAGFSASDGSHVSVFVGGRPWGGSPSRVPLSRHAEIVVEVGPHVPPHSSYTFPPGT